MSSTMISPVPSAPEGFIQAMDPVQSHLPAGYFDGPSEDGDGWRIDTTFTFESGVAFELMPPNGDYSFGGLTVSQALAAGTALARLAAKYA